MIDGKDCSFLAGGRWGTSLGTEEEEKEVPKYENDGTAFVALPSSRTRSDLCLKTKQNKQSCLKL